MDQNLYIPNSNTMSQETVSRGVEGQSDVLLNVDFIILGYLDNGIKQNT